MIETNWEIINPATAAQYLEANEANRNLRPRHVAVLARDLRAGSFQETPEPISFDVNGRLIDGQHRLAAIIESGVSHRFLVATNVPTATQQVLDSGVTRTAGDIMRWRGHVHGNQVAALANFAIRVEAGAVTRATSHRFSEPVTRSEIVLWSDAHPEVGDVVTYAKKLSRDLKASPTVIAYAYMRFTELDAEAASEFFGSIETMQTGGVGDPRLTLVRTLNRDSNAGSTNSMSLHWFYFSRAWNLWRTGEKVQLFRPVIQGRGALIPELV